MVTLVTSFVAALLAFTLPLAAYLRTLAPGEVGGDAGEFQVVPAILGVPHYTGYPLYTLLGHLWLAVDPVGTVALRMNALSALAAALACLAVFLAVRAAGGGVWSGLAGAATLAVCPLQWQWATIAGVRAAAGAFAALVLAAAFRWAASARIRRDRPIGLASQTTARGRPGPVALLPPGAAPDDEGRAATGWFLILCLALGLALAHHRSSVFFLPALAVYVVFVDSGMLRRWSVVLAGLVLILAPLLLYLYLPVRSAMGAAYDQFHPTTWPAFAELVFAPHLSQSLLTIPPAQWPGRALELGGALRDQLGPLTWLAAVGLAVAARFRARELICVGIFGGLVCAQVLGWNIGGGRLNVVYLIPVLVVCAMLAGAGTEACLRLAARILGTRHVPATALLLVVIAAGLVVRGLDTRQLQRAAAQAPLDAYHQDLTAGWKGHRLAAAALPYLQPNALIAADWEQATIFWYQKLVARTLPSVAIDFGSGSVADLSPEALSRQFPDRPVYLARGVTWATGRHPSAAGPLVSLSDQPRLTPPPGITALNATMEGDMQLAGYQLFDERGQRVADVPPASSVAGVMLVWKAEQRQQHDLSVSVRLLDSGSVVVRSVDNSSPVYGLAPTTTWSAGEYVSDYYELPLSGLAPGTYRLLALPYFQPSPGKFQNLEALDAAGKPVGAGAIITQLQR